MSRRGVPFVVVGMAAALPLLAQDARFVAEVDTDATPWTHLDFHDEPDNFQFAIVTDRTGGHRPGVFLGGIERVPAASSRRRCGPSGATVRRSRFRSSTS